MEQRKELDVDFFFFNLFFVVGRGCCCGVVRGFNKPGIESEDSSAEASHQDPLSGRECSFAGNLFWSLLQFTFIYYLLLFLFFI